MIKVSNEELEYEATNLYKLVRSTTFDTSIQLDVAQFRLQAAVVFLDIIRTELTARQNIRDMCKAMSEFNQGRTFITEEPCQCQ